MGNAWVFPSISHSMGKCNKTHRMGRTWEIGNHTFPIVWVFFPILFPSYDILHHMGNAWVFPSISHNTGKCNKTHCMGKTWEIGNHTFPIVWVLFSHPIPILWYTSSYGKCMGFPINFPQHEKIQQNPSYGEGLGNWYSYFSHSMGAFLQPDSHPVTYFITWEMLRFPHKFPIALENAAKSIELREPGKLVPILSPKYGYFLPSDFHPMVYPTPWKMHGFSHQFPIAPVPDAGTKSKTYQKKKRAWM